MSHLATKLWHVYSGDPLAFAVTVTSDAAAADVVAAEWRHPDVATLTLGGGLIVSDDADGNIVVEGDAGAPTLPLNDHGKEAHLLLDTGAGLQVIAVQRVRVSRRVAV